MANPIKIKCIVSTIIAHDDSVFTVKLKPTRRLPNYLPGQFLHLALDPFEPSTGFWPESRVFSIASTPLEPETTIAYTVKGKFTERMRDELSVGKEVWLKVPYGHFTLSAIPNEEIILVAGGTGITPFISFISMELNRPAGMPLKLVYGVRKPELFLFKDILFAAASKLKGFQISAFCEERASAINEFPVQQGKITLDGIWAMPQKPLNASYYLSGPIEMIRTFKNGLTDKDIDHNKIRIDEWE